MDVHFVGDGVQCEPKQNEVIIKDYVIGKARPNCKTRRQKGKLKEAALLL